MTSFKMVSRFGTLCGVLAIVLLTTGCPFLPDPCRNFNVNDNNPCTTDTCELNDDREPTAVHTPIANCCDTASDCNDNDVCTTDSCANINTTTGRGTCAHADVPGCCTANADCAAGEVCVSNECVEAGTGCDSNDDCEDGETCNTATGECETDEPECVNNADCADADDCTNNACVNGACVITDVECADGEVCVDGECVATCVENADCLDDGDECTTVECFDGACVTTTEDCDDGVACTDDSCDPATGDCTNEDNCTEGTCDPTTGECTGCEADVDCDDNDDCTTDSCVDGACENTNNTAACDDGNACTSNDTCADGACAGTPVVCASGEVCNPATGNCGPISCTTDANCNDNASCTADTCNLGTGTCEFTPIDTRCNDNLFCTGVEGAGSCDPDDADAEAATGCVRPGNPCVNPTPICQESNDSCIACTTNSQCNDGFSCTSDTCAAGSCTNTPVDTLCPDPLKCDGDDVCDPTNPDSNTTTGCFAPGNPCAPRVCNETTYVVGDPNTCVDCTSNADCSDGIACTQDLCDGVNGTCTNNPNDTLCPDTLFCNGDDVCDPKRCIGGIADGFSCAVPANCPGGTCATNPDAGADGCINGLPAYPCANACNEVTNACFACTANIDCSDGVACTTDTCDGGSGVCTRADNCLVGSCNYQTGQCE